MPGSPIEEIKNRLDIVEVIGSYIKLQKAGANYKALCPFHSEKTPSFFVSPSRQIWHCFGCSRGGDIFRFVMEIEGVEFGDALRILAQKAGVELKPRSPQWQKFKTERQRLYEICELSTKFFEKQLAGSPNGKRAKAYLLKRGISEESIKKWRLGWAPNQWRALVDFLLSRGYKKGEIVRAGVAIEKENTVYDRFRGRIIFPIFDLNSQVIGFSGREFLGLGQKAKYINTPNTLLYDKSRALYGLDKAKMEIRKRDYCILVEGNVDLIMASQAGDENTVATCGTALTPYQLRVLKRYSNNLLVAFDMDIAGEAATKRGIELAQSLGFDIRVVRLPYGKDPAEIILDNKKDWKAAIEGAVSIFDFYFDSAFGQADSQTPEGRKKILGILLPLIKRIPNKIEQSDWIQKLSKRLRAREEDIREELGKIKSDGRMSHEDSKESCPPVKKTRREMLEERLALLALKFPQDVAIISDKDLELFSPQIRELLSALKKGKIPKSEVFNILSFRAEMEKLEKKDVQSEMNFCINSIRSLNLKEAIDELYLEIKRAEEKGDLKRVEQLTERVHHLIQYGKENLS
ncbi:DNA primase [bacterium]|nr:DNA primase [bacterium]